MKKPKPQKLVVTQSNSLGKVLQDNITILQQKMISLYIAKLNPKDIKSRKVVIPLKEFEFYMNLKRANITRLKATAEELTKITLSIDKPDGGFLMTAFFTYVELIKDEKKDEWKLEFNCSEKLLPYLFDLHKNYFKYEFWNVLRLKEMNHAQLYRLLKQYQKAGEKIISLEDLKLCLGINGSLNQESASL